MSQLFLKRTSYELCFYKAGRVLTEKQRALWDRAQAKKENSHLTFHMLHSINT
jgi:hypothetical protein